MLKRYILDPVTFAEALITALVLFGLAVLMTALGRPGSAFIFFMIGLVFAVVAARNGRIVVIAEKGVSWSVLGFFSNFMSWDEIQEVGVIGLRIFFKTGDDKVGNRYIYIIPGKLDDQGRFDMILNWPPKKGIYLRYRTERYSAIQYRWDKKIVEYNAGDLKFDQGET